MKIEEDFGHTVLALAEKARHGGVSARVRGIGWPDHEADLLVNDRGLLWAEVREPKIRAGGEAVVEPLYLVESDPLGHLKLSSERTPEEWEALLAALPQLRQAVEAANQRSEP